jgi:hypothetical protein
MGAPHLDGPGFVALSFDIPFPIPIPNGHYLTYDPKNKVACIEVVLREGSRAFFRNLPIIGPTSFDDLTAAAREYERPRKQHSYIATSVLPNGTKKATLNVHTGPDGGYAECKYYSAICVTFLTDNIQRLIDQGEALNRACEVLNPFLDKYRLLNEDYRVTRISRERNFYVAICHTSPLVADELQLSPHELFQRLQTPRTFLSELGYGGSNVLRTNSFELLGPKGTPGTESITILGNFIQEEYELPLFYELILEALRCLQQTRDYALAVIHAETSFEVYVSNRLLKLMVDWGISRSEALLTIENNRDYWGIKARIKKLDTWAKKYCSKISTPYIAFFNSPLYIRWNTDLYQKRNSAIHEGVRSFSYTEASTSIGIAKECIITLEKQIPGISDRVQLNPSMSGFRENAGEVVF